MEEADTAVSLRKFGPDFDKVKYIMLKFHARELILEDYRGRFGTDILGDFGPAIESLRLLGLVRVGPKKLDMSPISEHDAFSALLFFIGKEKVKKNLEEDS